MHFSPTTQLGWLDGASRAFVSSVPKVVFVLEYGGIASPHSQFVIVWISSILYKIEWLKKWKIMIKWWIIRLSKIFMMELLPATELLKHYPFFCRPPHGTEYEGGGQERFGFPRSHFAKAAESGGGFPRHHLFSPSSITISLMGKFGVLRYSDFWNCIIRVKGSTEKHPNPSALCCLMCALS